MVHTPFGIIISVTIILPLGRLCKCANLGTDTFFDFSQNIFRNITAGFTQGLDGFLGVEIHNMDEIQKAVVPIRINSTTVHKHIAYRTCDGFPQIAFQLAFVKGF
jgi:hypothetical protein